MDAAGQLGEQLKAIRTKAGLSLRALGTLAKIPATTIEGYEAGNKIPADKFLRLAEALNHHTFTIDGNQFMVSRSDALPPDSKQAEQMNLNFLGEYDYSKASIRISPGRIMVSFEGARLSGRAKAP
jgi:transcriptional regulator with XRE-family HTH domain